MQRAFLGGAGWALRRGGALCAGPRWARLYSSEGMLKGTPSFARVKRKWSRRGPQDLLEDSAARAGRTDGQQQQKQQQKKQQQQHQQQGDDEGARLVRTIIRLSPAPLILILGTYVLFHISTYFYTAYQWPIPDDVKGAPARAILYLARYYELMMKNDERALPLLKRGLAMACSPAGGLDPDSPTALDLRLRLAACHFAVGEKAEAGRLLAEALPAVQRLALDAHESAYSGERDGRHETRPVPDMMLYRAAKVLGQVRLDSGDGAAAAEAYGIGLQAVKHMREAVTSTFDGNNPFDYAAYDAINLKEALLTCGLSQALFMAGDHGAADALSRAALNAVKQHKAHVDASPSVIVNVWDNTEDWECVDSLAMLQLARVQMAAENCQDALPWIVAGRKTVAAGRAHEHRRCVECESGFLSLLGRVAELQGNKKRALIRYREAYQHSYLNYGGGLDKLEAEARRLEPEIQRMEAAAMDRIRRAEAELDRQVAEAEARFPADEAVPT